MTKLELQLLNKKIHDRCGFDCGVPHLNKYLANQASSAIARSLSQTYVLVDTGRPSEIIGFYTLCYCSVTSPSDYKPLARYPHLVPALKLARMGVSKAFQGKGFGEQLLIDAIMRVGLTATSNENIPAPVVGLFVDAKDGAENFYSKYGFIAANSPQELWLSISNCVDVAMNSSPHN